MLGQFLEEAIPVCHPNKNWVIIHEQNLQCSAKIYKTLSWFPYLAVSCPNLWASCWTHPPVRMKTIRVTRRRNLRRQRRFPRNAISPSFRTNPSRPHARSCPRLQTVLRTPGRLLPCGEQLSLWRHFEAKTGMQFASRQDRG